MTVTVDQTVEQFTATPRQLFINGPSLAGKSQPHSFGKRDLDFPERMRLSLSEPPATRRRAGGQWLQERVLVAFRLALQDHELGLQEVREAFVHALAADAGLLEPAEAHAEVGTHRVVPHGARPQPCRDLTGPVDV